MTITMETLVSEILEALPEAEAVFEKYGVHVCLECNGVLDNPLDLCETMCGIDDIEGLLKDLQALADKK
jgi:iron-sulfur cluster repair protein YtfE (RIC family)